MSEDENTTAAEDCTFPAAQQPANRTIDAQHTDAEQLSEPAKNPLQLEISFATIHQSADFGTATETSDELELPKPTVAHVQHLAEPAVALQVLATTEPVQLQPEPTPFLVDQTHDMHLPVAHQSIANESNSLGHCSEVSLLPFGEASRGPDLSGLELLSNSIEAFEKNIFIKQEPSDNRRSVAVIPQSVVTPEHAALNAVESHNMQLHHIDVIPPPPHAQHLGGLNLLCALAEQRFQEEVSGQQQKEQEQEEVLLQQQQLQHEQQAQSRGRKRSTSSDGSDTKKPCRHHKDRERRGGKRSKHHKERRESRKSRNNQPQQLTNRTDADVAAPNDEDDTTEAVRQDFTESFNRVRAAYAGRNCTCTTAETNSTGHCCRDQCAQWPSAEEVFCAMNSDMRQRLAKMTKEVQEEKRKLFEIKHHQQQKPTTSPPRSVSTVSSAQSTPPPFELALARIQAPDSDATSSRSLRFDEADSNSTSTLATTTTTMATNTLFAVKHKYDAGASDGGSGGGSSIHSKKAKTLVEYIFASKKRLSECGSTDHGPSMLDENSHQSSSASASIKLEYGGDGATATTDLEDASSQDLFGSGTMATVNRPPTDAHRRKSKHHSAKHKRPHKSREHRKHHRRTAELRERKRRIDTRCTLTGELLDGLADKTNTSRVLTAMGGLFYAGGLSALQPPDVYAVTLDGERGNRPHIMSREEILRDAVSLMFVFCTIRIQVNHIFVIRFLRWRRRVSKKFYPELGCAPTGASSIGACTLAPLHRQRQTFWTPSM